MYKPPQRLRFSTVGSGRLMRFRPLDREVEESAPSDRKKFTAGMNNNFLQRLPRSFLLRFYRSMSLACGSVRGWASVVSDRGLVPARSPRRARRRGKDLVPPHVIPCPRRGYFGLFADRVVRGVRRLARAAMGWGRAAAHSFVLSFVTPVSFARASAPRLPLAVPPSAPSPHPPSPGRARVPDR